MTARGMALAALTLMSAASMAGAPQATVEALPALPQPVTNNAVAAVDRADGTHLVSLLGLGAGKTHADTLAQAWHLAPGADQWRRLPDVPGPAGRLAATAAVVAGTIYVFGGYTVAADGTEKSVATVHALDLRDARYTERAPMPVPVDDTVALVYEERYIFLISGWHDTGNVNLVQRYDAREDTWMQATPWPGVPVFGHAGGIVGNQLVVCDGVGIKTTRTRREFVAVKACLEGKIRPDEPTRIDWRTMPPHPGPALYRMAARGIAGTDEARVLFAGGSPNPYNYDGTGYDGKPSPASADIFTWSFKTRRWRRAGRLPAPSMDHRGAPGHGLHFYLIGGMDGARRVTARVWRLHLP